MTNALGVNESIRRCSESNTGNGRRMRHCETCQVPIGIMSRRSFLKATKCPVCGGKVHCVEVPNYEEEYDTAENLSLVLKVWPQTIRKWGQHGMIARIQTPYGYRYSIEGAHKCASRTNI